MHILFISDDVEIINFLSGLQAKAIMAQGDVEVSGISDNSMVTVICSGIGEAFHGMVTGVERGFPSDDNIGKWLSLTFTVRRIVRSIDRDLERAGLR